MAFTLPLLDIISGPLAGRLWDATQQQRVVEFGVKPIDSRQLHPTFQLRGTPLTAGAAYRDRENMQVKLREFTSGATFEITYDTGSASGVASCHVSEARLVWLGINLDTVTRLAQRRICTVGAILGQTEHYICKILAEGLPHDESVERLMELRTRLEVPRWNLGFQEGRYSAERHMADLAKSHT